MIALWDQSQGALQGKKPSLSGKQLQNLLAALAVFSLGSRALWLVFNGIPSGNGFWLETLS